MNTCIYIGSTADNLTAVRAPTEYSQSIQDLDSSSTTRSANGTMVGLLHKLALHSYTRI